MLINQGIGSAGLLITQGFGETPSPIPPSMLTIVVTVYWGGLLISTNVIDV